MTSCLIISIGKRCHITGLKVYLPNGKSIMLDSSLPADKKNAVAQDVIDRWNSYILRGWMTDDGDNPYSVEAKVKSLLDRLGYYILVGCSDDILTDYKTAIRTQREVPASSCPTFVEAVMYGGSAASNDLEFKRQKESFDVQMASYDDKASMYKRTPKKRKPMKDVRFDRVQQIRKEMGSDYAFTRCAVDTDNIFQYGGDMYMVDEQLPQYAINDDVSQMDRVIVGQASDGGIRFYDMNMENITAHIRPVFTI